MPLKTTVHEFCPECGDRIARRDGDWVWCGGGNCKCKKGMRPQSPPRRLAISRIIFVPGTPEQQKDQPYKKPDLTPSAVKDSMKLITSTFRQARHDFIVSLTEVRERCPHDWKRTEGGYEEGPTIKCALCGVIQYEGEIIDIDKHSALL